MANCPNKNLEEWKLLVASRGEDVAYYLWDKYSGNVPESESKLEIVKSGLKATNILQTPKADQFFGAVAKNKITGDFFWKKMQADLGIPKDQLEILKSFNTQDRGELISSLLANYSFAIEINTSKLDAPRFAQMDDDGYYTDGDFVEGKEGENTKYYSNLTVPGGTNYTENEIATPAITPSIKGHAQFATDQGIGWFRSDDQGRDNFFDIEDRKDISFSYWLTEIKGVKDPSKVGFDSPLRDEFDEFVNSTEPLAYKTKTRRILEVQSDLFQKGRDKENLDKNFKIPGAKTIVAPIKYDISQYLKEGYYITEQSDTHTFLKLGDVPQNSKENQFLQLLNQGSNWVTFFVKSIIQDSAKKGYEKVLFPSGDTASKVEGHQTLTDELTNLNKEIKELEDYDGGNVENAYLASKLETLPALKERRENLKSGGLEKLKPIYNFYENTVKNVLNKQYGKENVKQITDEYGNTWNEVEIVPEREQQPIFLQKKSALESSKASPETIAKVKELAKAMGIEIQDLVTYMKQTGIDNPNVNGAADLIRGIIAIAEGKEDVALTEEMVHIATALINLKNPQMITEMISKIDRFEIYQRTLNDYKNDPAYQLPNGKPDIRKIKKEAVDKLIAELIINESEGSTEFPELMNETNRSIIRRFWESILDFFRGQYSKSNIKLFGETARLILNNGVEGNVLDLDSKEIYYQLTDAQKNVQQKIQETKDNLKKVESNDMVVDPLLLDEETANNWYELVNPDGTRTRVLKRVTDRVKAWYKQRFGNKVFTPEEIKFNELKRDLGIKGHGYFEEVHGRYFNSDGTRKEVIDPRPAIYNPSDKDVYMKIEKYYTDLVASFSKEGKNPLVFSEVMLYDPKEKEAGTIDLLIIEEDGKANIFDWKFMSVAAGAKDVAWYKQGAYNVQLGRYKEMLRSAYGVKEIGMNRAIPIIMDLKQENPKIENSPMVLKGIAIGSVNTADIEDVRLIPVSEEAESTGFESLDTLLKKLNAVYKQISKSNVINEEEREFKRERMNILKTAIRTAQGSLNIAPLVDVIKIMRKEGQQILDDYKTIYEGRPATSQDFDNSQLSDFAEDMREYIATSDVFGRIDDLIGDLIYTADMEKNATTEEEKAEVAMRKDLLFNITQEAKLIRASEKDIVKASEAFADKFIGQRNLVVGLTKAEAVVKGLSSTFRGISDLPTASLQILYKLVTNAKGLASQKALGEVNELMAIRKKLADRGGDLRKLVQEIYQKDDKGKIANKLIYKFDRKFYDQVDKNSIEGDKQFILDNIDVDAYKAEALKIMNERISKIKRMYDEDEDLREKLIYEEQRKWDIDREDFNGFDNYVIKRHPLEKWQSEEYKKLKKDPELLSLYEFITKMNSKAKDAGYISNKVSSTFLPFVRKGMAESFAWDFSLSAVKNFGTNLSINADDVGYGSVNELTGELENSIPKYYTYDFTRGEDGVNDYSDVSEDIFKNMILYINHVEKYTYLTDVEGQLQLVKTIETFKDHLNTSRTGDVIIKDGSPEELKGNDENTKIFNDFLRALLYEQKYPLSDSDIPLGIGKVTNFMKGAVNKVAGREVFTIDDDPSPTSLVKTIDAANRAFQLKTLGFEFISGAVNLFGANIQIATQAGNYFKAREFAANEGKLIGNKFKNNDERKMFIQLIDKFMPLKDDPTYDKLRESGMSVLTRQNFSDMLMVFMRQPEQHVEKSIFLTLLQNMMVEDGKIVSIREFVKNKYKGRFDNAAAYAETKTQIDAEIEELKKTRSIDAIKELKDGELVIPGLDLNNTVELQRLTNLTRRISRNATGGLSDSDMNRMGMNIWTKSMMVFKNWIPKLVDTRFSELRRVSDDFSVTIDEDGISEGDKYDIGRVRLWTYVMGTSIRDKSSNIYNILSMNDKGIVALDKMYEDFAEKYERRTGKTFNMTKEDFIDMIKNNLRNEAKELAILLSLFGMMFSLGFIAPDDDDDKATKNLHRYTQRVIDKFIGELSFFYNPVEFQRILSGGMFPAIGIFSDIERFTSHTVMEFTGYDISNPDLTTEQVRKKAQPIKNLAKMFPFTKSLMTYGAIFDADFAKEFDITIQKESRR